MDFYLTVLIEGLCLSSMALGIYISMKIFNIPDITTDGSYTLGGAVTAVMLTHHNSVWLTIVAVVLSGAAAGATTGLIHTKLKINALLSGIIVMTALYGVNLGLMGRSNIPMINIRSLFTLVNISTDTNYNSLWLAIAFMLLIMLLVGYLLKTDFGISMRATGNSELMIRALGVNTDRMKITGLAIANALTALSGFLYGQYQGYADISMGIGIVIIGLGSVIIAETVINWLQITSVWLSLVLVLVGAVIFQTVVAVTLDIGVDPTYLKVVVAVFLLLIVGLPQLILRNSN
ncbi:MAG TPA: ABC transporter permease [Mucilaginibacter sp.]|jgi:putative ABC transport system permease protein